MSKPFEMKNDDNSDPDQPIGYLPLPVDLIAQNQKDAARIADAYRAQGYQAYPVGYPSLAVLGQASVEVVRWYAHVEGVIE
jgi:hypothetical protein